MATNHVSPLSFGQAQSDLGYSYVFAAEAIREEITERLDVLQMGIVDAIGDAISQSGTDVLRITRYGGLGFAETMQVMASETDPIVATGYTSDYDTITIARHGLAKSKTYQAMILDRPDAIGLEDMIAKVPESWLATMRSKVCTQGAAFSASVGTSGAAWTFDDELEMIAYFRETEGYEGQPVYTIRHPEQYTDLLNSIRNEPGFQTPEVLTALMGLAGQGGAFDFLGVRNHASWDVAQSTGDHVGFAYVAGALIWCAPSTTPIEVQNPSMAVYVPEFGMVLERETKGNIATGRFDVNAWFGVSSLDPTLFPQTKLVSIND